MLQYKNISGKDLWLPGIGTVKAEGIIKQPEGFNNANFVKVEEAKTPKVSEEDKGSAEPFERKKRFKTKEI